jgi:Uncharacterized protein conserved in bacteria (DUF2272)
MRGALAMDGRATHHTRFRTNPNRGTLLAMQPWSGRTSRWCFLLLLLAPTACTGPAMPDAHVPPFAKRPFEPFSREAAVAVALREWRLFGQNIADPAGEATRTIKPEREQGLWQRVGEYWWLGLNAKSEESDWTGKHDGSGTVFPPDQDGDYAWSAAFISYVMRIAGAGQRFPYSADHADYINAARRVSLGQSAAWIVSAERVRDYAPRAGDLICFGRGSARGLRYEDLPTPRKFTSHCDIVVDTTRQGQIGVIGGNVEDSVTLNYVPVTPDGKLATPDGVVLDTRFPWMTVLRVLDGTPVS